MSRKQIQAAHALWDALSEILEEPGALKSSKLRAKAMKAIRKAFAHLPQ